MARELESQTINGIYIPGQEQEELRSLNRLRQQLVKDQTRIKNRIKGLLLYYAKSIPDNSEMTHWSGKFIKYIEDIKFHTETGKQCLETYNRFKRKTGENNRSIKEVKKSSNG